MITARLTPLLFVSLWLSGCGSPPPPPEPAKPTFPPATGVWRGSSTRFQADLRNCPHPGLITLRVLDERFQYRWDANTWIDVTIDRDGSLHGAGPGITLIGKRDAKRIEGDVTNGPCGLHFTAVKQDT